MMFFTVILKLYFFIAAQIAQVAQSMHLKWARQLEDLGSNIEIQPHSHNRGSLKQNSLHSP